MLAAYDLRPCVLQMEQMSALRVESDRLMERMRASEANVAELEADLAAAQEQVAAKRAEADRCVHSQQVAGDVKPVLQAGRLPASDCMLPLEEDPHCIGHLTAQSELSAVSAASSLDQGAKAQGEAREEAASGQAGPRSIVGPSTTGHARAGLPSTPRSVVPGS